MKIALINVTAGGSTGKIMTYTAEYAASKGDSCVIYYGRGSATTSEKVRKIRIESKLRVLVHGAMARFLGRNGSGSIAATKRLVRMLKKQKPDVIQLHNLHGYYLNIDILFEYLKTCGAKIYWTLHDCWSFTGGCAYFTSLKCEKWKTGCGNCPGLGFYPKSRVDRTDKEYIHKKNAFTGVPNMTVITPCKWLEDLVKQSFLSEYETVCIYNGIDITRFSGENAPETELPVNLPEKYILGVASVWDSRKRPDVFARVADMLAPHGYGAVAVGKAAPDAFPSKENNVIHIERTENVDVLAKLYKNAVCLVSTSVDDTFPTVGLESMAAGTPVVYSDVCGCGEQLGGQYLTGYDVEPDKPILYAVAARMIDERRDFFSTNCIKKAKEQYSQEIMGGNYFDLWHKGKQE